MKSNFFSKNLIRQVILSEPQTGNKWIE